MCRIFPVYMEHSNTQRNPKHGGEPRDKRGTRWESAVGNSNSQSTADRPGGWPHVSCRNRQHRVGISHTCAEKRRYDEEYDENEEADP